VSSSEASLKRGKEMFEAIECHKCHGTEGRADGPSRPELKDEWGFPVAPANLTKRWTFRGGGSRTDIATRLANGVLGTPMPAFLDSVEKPEDIWHLTNYIVSLGPDHPTYATLITVTAVTDAIPDDPAAEFWKKPAASQIALMGQVIVDPRNFNPSIDLVTIRAAYNDKESPSIWRGTIPASPRGRQADLPGRDLPAVPAADHRWHRAPVLLDGRRHRCVVSPALGAGQGVGEASANGPAKIAALPGGEASGKAVYTNGQYRLVMKRPLAGKGESRPTFRPAVFTPVAIQAWDVGAGETGTRMSLTSWSICAWRSRTRTGGSSFLPSWQSSRWRPCSSRARGESRAMTPIDDSFIYDSIDHTHASRRGTGDA